MISKDEKEMGSANISFDSGGLCVSGCCEDVKNNWIGREDKLARECLC